MKTTLAPSLRTAALVSALFLLPAFAATPDAAAPDHAAHLLASRGEIPVEAVGPHVEIGTYLIQVSVKLGRPTARLDDYTWLYENFRAENSSASGTLIVRFAQGRVSSLTLATPTVVAALRNSRPTGTLVASHDRR